MKTISFLDATLAHTPEVLKQADRDNLDHDKILISDCFLHVPRNNRIKVAWLIEPDCISPQTYVYIKQNYSKFTYVLTHTKSLLDQIPNAVFYSFGTSFIKPEDFKIYNKTKNVSMIASNKTYCKGHEFRHIIRKSLPAEIDIFGTGINPIDYKLDGLKDYRYSIAMENSKHDFYFTEKLIDCFLTGTIPIYWGCPGIGKFFNTDGMMIFDSKEEAHQLLEKTNTFDYDSKRFAIEQNFELAKQYVDTWNSVYNFVESI